MRALKHSFASLSHFWPEVTRASFSHSLKIIEQDVFSSLFSYIFKVPEIRVLSSKDNRTSIRMTGSKVNEIKDIL